jgi:hypothetical protein
LRLVPGSGLPDSNDQAKGSPPPLAKVLQDGPASPHRAIGCEDIGCDLKPIREEFGLNLDKPAPEVVNSEPNVCLWAMELQLGATPILFALLGAKPAKKEPLSHLPPFDHAAHRASS